MDVRIFYKLRFNVQFFVLAHELVFQFPEKYVNSAIICNGIKVELVHKIVGRTRIMSL